MGRARVSAGGSRPASRSAGRVGRLERRPSARVGCPVPEGGGLPQYGPAADSLRRGGGARQGGRSVDGSCPIVGAKAAQQTLSERRAKAVADVLVAQGV